MALGRKNKTPNGKLLVLKIKTQDANKKAIPATFEVWSKNAEGKYAPTGEVTDSVTGNLTKIEIKEQEWKGDKYNTVALVLSDGEETYLIDARVNMLTRSLFNSVLGLKTFEDISVSLYSYKKKDKAGVEQSYNGVSIWQNDEQVKWAIDLKDQPKPTATVFKGKTMNDYTEVDNFFLEKLRAFAKVIETSVKGGRKSKPAANTAPSAETPTPVVPDEDVPF